MKKGLLLLCLSGILYSCDQQRPETGGSSGIEASATVIPAQVFGAAFTEENRVPASQLIELAAGKDAVQATVEAVIRESCQAKGCWMDVKLGDNSSMKVTFRDYGFFLPVENLEGRTVVFTGTAKRKLISVDDQRHYAQDAGKSAAEIASITVPKEEMRFVADGVILK